RSVRLVALAGVTIVEQHQPVAPRQVRTHEVPALAVAPESHQEEQRLSEAVDLIGQLELSEAHPRHGARVSVAPSRKAIPHARVGAMHEKFLSLTQPVYEYLVAHTMPPHDVLRDLAEETAALGPVSVMQVAIEQGAFLTVMARLMGARRAVE